MARIGLGKILAGVAGVAAAGAAWLYLREKSIETPKHETLDGDGAFELRRYGALIVAETMQQGGRDRALGNGFGLLADYIFAESREGEEIATTAPVLAVPAGRPAGRRGKTGQSWTIRFVMPAALARNALPVPGPGVAIAELPARTMAVVKFGGRADDAMLAAKETMLRAWMADRDLKAKGPAEHAFYNSPIMPGPLRQNEVLIEVETAG